MVAKRGADSSKEIEKLLAERNRLEDWLNRLEHAGDKGGPEVRKKVRQDYQSRLDQVLVQLGEFTGELEAALEAQSTRESELSVEKAGAEGEMSEAELRHTVGEYSDKEWQEIKAEKTEVLERLDQGLEEAGGEIERLEEVLALARGKREEKAPSVQDLAEEIEEELPEPDEFLKEPQGKAAPESAPAAPAAGKEGSQTDAFQELQLLKSVSEDEERGPSPARASGSVRIPDDVVETEGRPEETAAAGGRQHTKSGTVKTLKCSECGTMNLPTEWYCEQCGAELAVL